MGTNGRTWTVWIGQNLNIQVCEHYTRPNRQIFRYISARWVYFDLFNS